VWVGIGAVDTAVMGMLLFGGPTEPPRRVSLGLTCAGSVGLKLAHG